MKKIKIIGIGSICIFTFLFLCANPLGGNGTRIGNPRITGTIYKPDGKTPAANVIVYLRNKNTLADIGNMTLRKQTSDTAVVKTNVNGEFAIDSIDCGTYVIECSDENNNYALYELVTVDSTDSLVRLPADTLKPAGAISGSIRLPEGGNLNDVYVLAFGIQRYSTVNSSGYFCLNNLAEGVYDLRIISSMEDYGFLDLTKISVPSGDTTILEPFELPFTGTPIINNLSIDFDTLKQIVSVTWNKIDTSLLLGFNVYRSTNENAAYEKINNTAITDSIFIDSSVTPNQTISYRVSVIKKDTTEGVKSQKVSVYTAIYFSVDTSFSIRITQLEGKRSVPHTLLYDNGLFYAVESSIVQVYDTNFNIIRNLSADSLSPNEVAASGNGHIYVSSKDNSIKPIESIFIFDQNGVLEKKIRLYDSLNTESAVGIRASLFTVDSKGHFVFVSINRDSVYVCDTSGVVLKCWGGYGDGTGRGDNCGISLIYTDSNDYIYVYEFVKSINIYTTDGNLIKAIDPSKSKVHFNTGIYPISYVSGIAVEKETNRIYLCHGGDGIAVLTPDGELITDYQVPSLQNIILKEKNIYVTNSNGLIKLINNLP